MKPIAATTKQPTLSAPNAEAAAPNNNDRPACCGLLIAIQAHTTNAKSANHPSIHQIINVNLPRTLRQRPRQEFIGPYTTRHGEGNCTAILVATGLRRYSSVDRSAAARSIAFWSAAVIFSSPN